MVINSKLLKPTCSFSGGEEKSKSKRKKNEKTHRCHRKWSWNAIDVTSSMIELVAGDEVWVANVVEADGDSGRRKAFIRRYFSIEEGCMRHNWERTGKWVLSVHRISDNDT